MNNDEFKHNGKELIFELIDNNLKYFESTISSYDDEFLKVILIDEYIKPLKKLIEQLKEFK